MLHLPQFLCLTKLLDLSKFPLRELMRTSPNEKRMKMYIVHASRMTKTLYVEHALTAWGSRVPWALCK